MLLSAILHFLKTKNVEDLNTALSVLSRVKCTPLTKHLAPAKSPPSKIGLEPPLAQPYDAIKERN